MKSKILWVISSLMHLKGSQTNGLRDLGSPYSDLSGRNEEEHKYFQGLMLL